MKILIASILCFVVPVTVFAADNVYKVGYDGGSIQGIKAGTDLKLYLETAQVRLVKDKTEVATIPVAAITEVSYGQDVHRRVGAAVAVAIFTLGAGALLALAKSKKHFVGLVWDDGAGKKGGVVFQADKNDYRGLLAGLEGVTGKKAVDSDALNVKN